MVHNKYKTDCLLKKTVYIILISLVVVFAPAYSQSSRKKAPPLKERLFFGGSFGLQIGTITDIEVSPIVGIWVLPRLAVAAGPDYIYYKDPLYSSDVYGGSAYVQFYFIKDLNSVLPAGIHTGLFFHVENELLSLQSSFWKTPPYPSDRFFINTILGGGGISLPLSKRLSLNLMFLWSLNDQGFDIYGNPEIRISLIF
jgi:hypothetical protein